MDPILLYSTQSAQKHPELNRLAEHAIGDGMAIPPLRPNSWFVARELRERVPQSRLLIITTNIETCYVSCRAGRPQTHT